MNDRQPLFLEAEHVETSKGSGMLKLKVTGDYGAENIEPVQLNKAQIMEVCDAFWDAVNVAGLNDIRRLNQNLMMKGRVVCEKVFPRETIRNTLINQANAGKTIVIYTNLFRVPWGHLYFPETNAFLQDMAPVTIRPITSELRRVRGSVACGSEWGFICDSELNFDYSKFANDMELFTRVNCENLEDLFKKVKDMSYINLIAHFDAERPSPALRLSKDNYYCDEAAACYCFPTGSTVILSTCQGGAIANNSDFSLAARISAFSQCCVIASCCILPVASATEIVFAFSRRLKTNPNGGSFLENWRTFQKTECATKPFVKFYSVYGSTYGAVI